MKKKVIIITLSVIIVILSIIGLVWVLTQKQTSNPEEILKKYMSFINEQNYEGMYELINNENTSKEEFIKRNKNIYEGIEATNLQISINNIEKVNDETTKINYTTNMQTLAGEVSFENTVKLNKKEKNYYIEWDSKLIFPELNNTDKVKVTTQKAKRGSILDRKDVELAKQGTVSSIGLVPGKMNQETKTEDIEKIAELLEIDSSIIDKNLSQSYVKDDTFVPIKMVAKNNYEIKEKLLEIKGIKITDETARVYPYGEETAHLIGYVQNVTAEDLEKNKGKGYTASSVIGKAGLEKVYEERLKGSDGCEIYIAKEDGTKKKTIAKVEVKNGEDIKLTIDIKIQDIVYKEYEEDESATVVIEPTTGEVLAMVSTPSYDPNSFVLGISSNQWNSIANNEKKPLYNRYQATWTPGSSFKPIIGAIGLTTGAFTADEDFGKSGTAWQKDESWGTYKVTTLAQYNGKANLQNALIYSDNIYFAKSALKIGEAKLKEQLNKIGFNKSIDFSQAMTSSKFSNTDKFESEVQLADSGYGQGQILVNPLHMASIYSAFVNDGNMIQPYIEYGQEKKYYVENAFSKESANEIKEDLLQVVENAGGTAHSVKTEKVMIAGKTGTAEIKNSKDDTEGTEIGWFNAFTANEDNKNQMLVISMVENVKNKGGSHYLLPKVKRIFEKCQ